MQDPSTQHLQRDPDHCMDPLEHQSATEVVIIVFLTGDLNLSAPPWPARTQGAAPARGHTLLFPAAMFIGCF